MSRRSNTRYASSVSTSEPDAESWAVFDALPGEVRRALWETPVPINPLSVVGLLGAGVPSVLSMIRDGARAEVGIFAAEHRKRFGYPLPHQAAWVSLQGY